MKKSIFGPWLTEKGKSNQAERKRTAGPIQKCVTAHALTEQGKKGRKTGKRENLSSTKRREKGLRK